MKILQIVQMRVFLGERVSVDSDFHRMLYTNDRVLAIFYIPLGTKCIDFVKFQIFSVRLLSVVPSADLILRPFTLLRNERPL